MSDDKTYGDEDVLRAAFSGLAERQERRRQIVKEAIERDVALVKALREKCDRFQVALNSINCEGSAMLERGAKGDTLGFPQPINAICGMVNTARTALANHDPTGR